jgi:hypothetical protein
MLLLNGILVFSNFEIDSPKKLKLDTIYDRADFILGLSKIYFPLEIDAAFSKSYIDTIFLISL